MNEVKITSMPNIPNVTPSSQPIGQYLVLASTNCYAFPRVNVNNINGTLDNDKISNIYAKRGEWFLVNPVNPQRISSNYVIPSSPLGIIAKGKVVNSSGDICGENPSENDRNTGIVSNGTILNIYKECNGWYLSNST